MSFEFTLRTALLLVAATTSLLLLSLGLMGRRDAPWDGTFAYESQPVCAETSYDPSERGRRRPLDPAFDYVPFYDLYANRDCSDYARPLRKRPLADFVQCGLKHYGPYRRTTLSWAFGPDHHGQHAPGSAGGANWKALGDVGRSLYAQDGLMLGRFEMGEQGALRDPHWHSNAAEFTYIIRGTARVTVAGLPRTDPAYGMYSPGAMPPVEARRTRTVEGSARESETFILRPGDAFYSPVGFHHFFEDVDASDPLIGIAVFDTSDLKTFDTPQMMKALPNEMLSQVLDIPKEQTEDFYRGFRRAFVDPHGDWNEATLADEHAGNSNADLRFKIPSIGEGLTAAPRSERNGEVKSRAIDASTWGPLGESRFSFAYTEIGPGSTLEPYWTDNADELVYVLEGEKLEVVRSSNGKRECKDVFTVREGYLIINEIGSTWLVENKSRDVTAKLMRIFNSNRPSVTTLYDAFHSLPEDVVKTMLREKYYNQYEYYAVEDVQ